MEEFIKVSEKLGKEKIYVQAAGGNSSIKIHNKLYVKSSGEKMKNMKINSGYVCIYFLPIIKFLQSKKRYRNKDELSFIQLLESQVIREESYGLPSMETGFHAILPSTYVFHIHSVYVNTFACMKYGEREIKKIFIDIPFDIIDYKTPGYELAYYMVKNKSVSSVIFLKNHGVIVHGDDIEKCLVLIRMLHTRIEEYLKFKNAFIPFTLSQKHKKMDKYLFPDSAVFTNVQRKKMPDNKKNDLLEINSAQQYILQAIKRLNKRPSFLSNTAVQRLRSMKQEKHRLEFFKK